jgi:hypothetical protein
MGIAPFVNCRLIVANVRSAHCDSRGLGVGVPLGGVGQHIRQQLDRADIDRAAALLAQAADDQDADVIPPFELPVASAPPQLDTRVTRNLEIDDPAFQRWRAGREDDRTIVQRMTTRQR